MTTPVNIVGNGLMAKVTASGELVTASLEYDTSVYNALATGTASNFFGPKVGKQFIITGFLAVSDKLITADVIIEIFEASSSDTTVVDKTIMKFALTKNAEASPTPLRIKVSAGKWVNAKDDDDTVHLTMFGYYIKEIKD